MITAGIWLKEIRDLLWRISPLGIDADIASMGLCELWSVYCLLRRLAES